MQTFKSGTLQPEKNAHLLGERERESKSLIQENAKESTEEEFIKTGTR